MSFAKAAESIEMPFRFRTRDKQRY